jgi:hypothetical protein
MVSKSQSKAQGDALAGERLIITVKEARKLLGKDFKQLGDKQIEDIVTKLDLLAQGFIAEKVSI